MFFCFGFCIFIYMVHIMPHVTDLEISAATAANILASTGGAILVSGIVIGGIADRIGNRQAFIICFILISAALFFLLTAREVWMLYLTAAVLGFGSGGGATLESPLVAELFGIRSHGLIMGVQSFSITIGAASGPFIAGYIFDSTGSYQAAFTVCAAVSVVGLILAVILRPVKKLDIKI
jgi:MFS family permease